MYWSPGYWAKIAANFIYPFNMTWSRIAIKRRCFFEFPFLASNGHRNSFIGCSFVSSWFFALGILINFRSRMRIACVGQNKRPFIHTNQILGFQSPAPFPPLTAKNADPVSTFEDRAFQDQLDGDVSK